MNNVYNIFTGRLVDLSTIEYKAPVAWSFNDIMHKLQARFEDKLPKFVTEVWDEPSNEPYAFGCTHNIQYRTVRSKHWNDPMPFPMRMNPNSSVIGSKVKQGGSDPLAWMDNKYKVSYNHILSRKNKPLTIHTRSDLIATQDYIDVLDKDCHKVIMYVLDADESIVRLLEPGAPSNSRRLKAVQVLKDNGINVEIVNISLASIKNKVKKYLKKVV